MAVAFDAVSPSAAGQTNVGGGSQLVSWNHTVTGSNALLFVLVAVGTPGTSDANTVAVTYNSLSLTSVAGQVHTNAGTNGFIELFQYTGPATGSAYSITVTVTGTNHRDICAAALSFNGVDQVTPLGTPSTNTGYSTTPAFASAIGSAVGNMVVAFQGNGSGASATMTVATEQFDSVVDNLTGCGCASGGNADGAATVNPVFTTTSDWWAAIGVDIHASGGVAGGPPMRTRTPEQKIRTRHRRSGGFAR